MSEREVEGLIEDLKAEAQDPTHPLMTAELLTDAADALRTLTAERDEWAEQHAAVVEGYNEVVDENERLREALKPGSGYYRNGDYTVPILGAGDFRRAARALEPETEG